MFATTILITTTIAVVSATRRPSVEFVMLRLILFIVHENTLARLLHISNEQTMSKVTSIIYLKSSCRFSIEMKAKNKSSLLQKAIHV